MQSRFVSNVIKKISLPKNYIYEFFCPKDIFSELVKFSELIDWSSSIKRMDIKKYSGGRTYFSKKGSLKNDDSLMNLHVWAENCLNKVKNDIGFYKNNFEQLNITQSWINLSEKGDAHHEHSHPLSILSGLVYLTANATTNFSVNSIYANPFLLPGIDSYEQFSHAGKKGTLIIFPSNLYHYVGPHLKKNSRITFSFNSWFKGSLGNFKNASYIPQNF